MCDRIIFLHCVPHSFTFIFHFLFRIFVYLANSIAVFQQELGSSSWVKSIESWNKMTLSQDVYSKL